MPNAAIVVNGAHDPPGERSSVGFYQMTASAKLVPTAQRSSAHHVTNSGRAKFGVYSVFACLLVQTREISGT